VISAVQDKEKPKAFSAAGSQKRECQGFLKLHHLKKKMVAPFWTYFEAIHIFTQHCIGSPAHGDETKLQ
jgi:hypothetical protein